MKRIVLLRHGESTWNKDNRFTGWTDVDLTEKGIADANQAGILLKEKGFHFDKAYTSFLKRAVKTLNCVLDKMDQDWIPVEKSWRLNEKHYGALQGLNKSETASKYGEEQVLIWRRSFNVAPNALPEDDPRNPATIAKPQPAGRATGHPFDSLLHRQQLFLPYITRQDSRRRRIGARMRFADQESVGAEHAARMLDDLGHVRLRHTEVHHRNLQILLQQ